MNPLWRALAYLNAKKYDACAAICVELLMKNRLDQAAWFLKVRAMVAKAYIDADLNNTLQINGANMNALRTNNAIFNFPRKVIDNSITITRSKIGQEELITLADYTGGKIIPNGLLLNGISFTIDIEVEERFLDDLRRAYSIIQQMHTLQELRPKGAFVQLTLSSSFELPASKRDIARKVLLSAVEQSSDQLSGELNSWIISIIRTDFTNTQTLQTQTRPSNAQLSSKHELVHSRFNTPVISHKNEDEEPEKQYVIGPPRKIVGSPEKQIFFWTFIFAIVLLGVVTAYMWLMTVYEDPLIYLICFILEQDHPLKDDVI
ncbi:MAG: hypothetical protein EZS28_010518 [Streblomastix strix]|uniref:Uncharacterized protein n=1 Tax=Streblomastix strix TaxID=222440 RepID=A0A5J4WGY7_9EUKA|nr:MAG: hypothetical protein EZS28_010518 [Streblomastix strix]